MASDADELTSFLTQPSKRRRMVAVQPSAPKASDLLAKFGARQSRSSVSRAAKMDRHATSARKISYAESTGSEASPVASRAGSAYEESPMTPESPASAQDSTEYGVQNDRQDESDDELLSDDVIHVRMRSVSSRKLPQRSARAKANYASPKEVFKKISKFRQKPVRLGSDLALPTSLRGSKPRPETERGRVRNEIADKTKPKRNAFLLLNKEYFLPLLPETSYIDRLQRIQDMNEDDEPAINPYTSFESQPENVMATMKPYQLEGLSFLAWMYSNGMSAILGDEMGLGKTLQTLSLFQYLKNIGPAEGQNRPCLVVCPLSVLSSWMNEAKKWVPKLHTVRFHGPKSERNKLKENCRSGSPLSKSIDIMVTTYETFVTEQSWFKQAFVWRYCVLDEGHKIKNNKSNVSTALQGLSAEYRLLLTGTPLQNNLLEMWALLHWLFPDVFTINTADKFEQAFNLSKGNVSTSFMDDARSLLELIMLRRMKHSPGVDLGLPPKDEILLYVPLTPMQRFWYTRLLTKADNMLLDELFKGAKNKEVSHIEQLNRNGDQDFTVFGTAAEKLGPSERGTSDAWAESKEIMQRAIENEQAETGTNEWKKLMNLVMQLRKVCSHPYILPHAGPDPYYLGEHIKTASGKFIVLDKLVSELVANRGKKILIFSQFTSTLDLCEDLLMLKGANAVGDAPFRYLRFDGSTVRARRNLSIRMFNDMNSEYKIMLISTKAGGLGINLTSASDVVFMDDDWNPQVTLQAEARSHRIGQTQKVTVYKLCTQGTVEEQMMGRIRKKLYLSTKITESMRNIHSATEHSKKRKRGRSTNASDNVEDAPKLDTGSLKSLVRRGAQTLARPEVDVTEMLSWDWETTLEKCKDKPIDVHMSDDTAAEDLEQSWLNSMEKVETAVFEGKKHQRAAEKAAKQNEELVRGDRRLGKNTTVMVGGFAISKESMNCADWEAVPTFAGKDPRLAEPVREKKRKIRNQDYCVRCWDDGTLTCCSGCPRAYHVGCLQKDFQLKAKSKNGLFFCPQHECVDCQSKTVEAGGMIFRCRWCENGYCEDCLDWDTVQLIGDTLPEYEMIGFEPVDQAWYVDCPSCIKHWRTHKEDAKWVQGEKARLQEEYEAFLAESKIAQTPDSNESTKMSTPATVSEVATPIETDVFPSASKKAKLGLLGAFEKDTLGSKGQKKSKSMPKARK